jgi:hypothetical protein
MKAFIKKGNLKNLIKEGKLLKSLHKKKGNIKNLIKQRR